MPFMPILHPHLCCRRCCRRYFYISTASCGNLSQERFTQDVAPQYVYSPRELSRWVRAMYEAMEPLEAMTNDELVRREDRPPAETT